ncbi:MAG: hypothetical protein K0R25_197 [Rickettsiaceae bacterium]|jgi:prepilin-type N-terminal cleavage/methylation domain-containing protein|nr:hypothetical protein [Rickettsiaceae bacterium]
MKYSKKKLGFTLIEMSLVILIITILMVAVSSGSGILEKIRLAGAQSLTKASPVIRISNLLVWYETTMENNFNYINTTTNTTNQDNVILRSGDTIQTWRNINPYRDLDDASPTCSTSSQPYCSTAITRLSKNDAISGDAPTYYRSIINGLPVVRFNGATNYLNFDGSALSGSNYSVIIVEQRRSTQSANYFLCNNSAVANENLILGYKTNTILTFAHTFSSTSFDITVAGYIKRIPRIHVFRFNSSLGRTHNMKELQTTAVQDLTLATTNNATGKTVLSSYTSPGIGGVSGGCGGSSTAFYNGDIGEIIIFTKYINDDEMNDIIQYLSKKWKI